MTPETCVLVVTGPVGAGKTTIAHAIASRLKERYLPHAVVDMDGLRQVYPSPPGDRFATRIGYRNLSAIWPNLRAAHPRVVILADVVESQEQRREYEDALPGTRVTLVRLNVPMDLVLARLETRESGDSIGWYRQRAPELEAIMERETVGDLVIEAGTRDPAAIAGEILDRLL